MLIPANEMAAALKVSNSAPPMCMQWNDISRRNCCLQHAHTIIFQQKRMVLRSGYKRIQRIRPRPALRHLRHRRIAQIDFLNKRGYRKLFCASAPLHFRGFDARTRSSTLYSNCAIVVANARDTTSSSGRFRSSDDNTSIPHGPRYPTLCKQRTNPFTSNSPSPHKRR
jgi:hypothetical protein